MPNCWHNKRNLRRELKKKALEKRKEIIGYGYDRIPMWYGFPGGWIAIKRRFKETGETWRVEESTYTRHAKNSTEKSLYKKAYNRKIRHETDDNIAFGKKYHHKHPSWCYYD